MLSTTTPEPSSIAALTGTNGKTTTARMLAHVLKMAGHVVGQTSTDAVYIDGNVTVKGDMTGPVSAKMVLRDPSVSKLHAHFRRRDDEKLELVDLGSQNGTRINSRLLVPHQPESVSASDQLVFGGVNAKLVDADQLYELLTAK